MAVSGVLVHGDVAALCACVRELRNELLVGQADIVAQNPDVCQVLNWTALVLFEKPGRVRVIRTHVSRNAKLAAISNLFCCLPDLVGVG